MLYSTISRRLLLRRGVYDGVVILSFHKVVELPYFRQQMTISLSVFKGLLDYLQKTTDIISLEEILVTQNVATRSKRLKVVLTFDDGYYDNYTLAFPELKKRGIPATIFLPSGYIGTSKLLWWDMVDIIISSYDILDMSAKNNLNAVLAGLLNEKMGDSHVYNDELKNKVVNAIKKLKQAERERIEKTFYNIYSEIEDYQKKKIMLDWSDVIEMSNYGIKYGGHTVSHPNMDEMSNEQVLSEIESNKLAIEEKLNVKISTFAYPSGRFNKEHYSLLEKAGYKISCTTEMGFVDYGKINPLMLPRIDVSTNSIGSFLNGFSPSLWTFQLFKFSK